MNSFTCLNAIKRILVTKICIQSISTTTINNATSKEVKMLNKIMLGRDKGKRRWFVSNEIQKSTTASSLLKTKGQGKESFRRVQVLNKLFMKHITDFMATGQLSEDILGYGIQVTQVKVAPDFRGVNVFWFSQERSLDTEIELKLKRVSGELRHELSQLKLMGEVPKIHFVFDKRNGQAAEVESLLQIADFGDDYESSSPTDLLKNELKLSVNLPDRLKTAICEIEEQHQIQDVEESMPPMRNDVLGLNQEEIMNKVRQRVDKSRKAWDEYNKESVNVTDSIINNVPSNFESNDTISENPEDLERDKFKKFLEQKQYSRKQVPERKRHRRELYQSEDLQDDETYEPSDDDDYIDEFELYDNNRN